MARSRLDLCLFLLLMLTILIPGISSKAIALPHSSLIAQAQPPVPIRSDSISEIVQRFTPTTQLYMKGEPLSEQEQDQLLQILKTYPNIFVVLIDTSLNIKQDDLALSRGIGNSPGFLSVVHPILGERQGILLMIYFDSDRGRQIYMRAEELPDRLGVGEAHFADPQGNPRELLALFVGGIQDQGLSVPLALERVMERIDGTLMAEVEQQGQQANRDAQRASQALGRFQEDLAQFKKSFMVGGAVGDPPVQQWQQDLEQIQQALEVQELTRVSELSTPLIAQIEEQHRWVARYRRALQQIGALQEQNDRLQAQLIKLRQNQPARQAQALAIRAQENLERFSVSSAVGDLDFWDAFEAAQRQIQALQGQIESSQAQTRFVQRLKMGAMAGGVVLGIGVGAMAYSRSSRRRQQGQVEWREAQTQIGTMTQELMQLMDEADYTILAGYRGQTQQAAQELIQQVTDALTLISGAEKFLMEAKRLLHSQNPLDRLTQHRSNQAIRLLSDPKTTLPFSLTDSARIVLQSQGRAESWREWILSLGTSREFRQSLQQVLLQMAEKRDRAQALLTQITQAHQGLADYLDQTADHATQLRGQWSSLQSQAESRFTIPCLEHVFTQLLSDEVAIGLIAGGKHCLQEQDPMRGWQEFGQPAEILTETADQILQISAQAQNQLLPHWARVRTLLQEKGIHTEWMDQQVQALSDHLNQIADQANPTSVSDALSACRHEIELLEEKFDQATQQSQQWQELLSTQIPDLEAQIQSAREQITRTLQQQDRFQSGTPSQALREPNHDPTALLATTFHHLQQLKLHLGQGDTASGSEHLQQAQEHYRQAQTVVDQSVKILESYPQRFQDLQTWRQRLLVQISSQYRPGWDRIRAQYHPSVFKPMAVEVGCGDTLDGVIQRAEQDLERADPYLAELALTQALLLQTDQELQHCEHLLQISQQHLDGLLTAETHLVERQRRAEIELGRVEQALGATLSQTQGSPLRPETQALVRYLQSQQQQARQTLRQSLRDPLQAEQEIAEVEQLCPKLAQQIQADKRNYQAAICALAKAEAAISNAKGDLEEVDHSGLEKLDSRKISQTLEFAEKALQQAEMELSQAQAHLRNGNYESAAQQASAADQKADQASRQSKEAQEQARILIHQSLTQVGTTSSVGSFSSTSGSSFGGGFDGGGSSGSFGSGFDGGGSGSSGGGW